MANSEEIITGQFVDCEPTNEINAQIMLNFGNILERYMTADEEKADEEEFDEFALLFFPWRNLSSKIR